MIEAEWQDRSCYERHLLLDRTGWAWEWLRRNPDYQRVSAQRPVTIAFETSLN